MAYNSDNRSERLLQGRRFTTDNLSLGQEAFTDVFDLGAGEILTDDGLIPTGSAQLAYSGSSQNGAIVSGSVVNPSIGTDVPVAKYHWRKKLKQAADGQREVYYFTTSEPSSVSDTVTSDQLIETDQQTNFISPKYIIASDSPNNTESSTPGYKVVVYKDTASSAGSISSSPSDPASYVFDFKTGVLTWVGSNQPSSNQFVYITTYQYVGRTLRSQIDDGSIGTIPAGTVSGSVQITSVVTDTYISASAAASGFGAGGGGGLELGTTSTTALAGDTETITSAESTKLSFVSVTQAVDLDTMETNIGTNNNKVGYTTVLVKSKLDADNVISGSAGIVAGLVGQNLNIGELTATKVITNIVSQSIAFATGSARFGDEITDAHQMTGSLSISGSLAITGSLTFGSIDGGNF